MWQVLSVYVHVDVCVVVGMYAMNKDGAMVKVYKVLVLSVGKSL